MLVAPSLLQSWRAAIINCLDSEKEEKSKVGPTENKELKNCSGSKHSNWQTGLWKQRAGILQWECQGQGNSMRGDLSSQVGSEGDLLLSVFFCHATRGIIKQPIVFMANVKNRMQSASDAAIHGKVSCPSKSKNYPHTAPRQGHTAFSAQQVIINPPLWSWWLSGACSGMFLSIQTSKSSFLDLETCTLKHKGRHNGPTEVTRNLTSWRPELSSR